MYVCVMLCIILLYYVLQHRAPHGWYINKVYEGRDMNFVRADPWSTCVSKIFRLCGGSGLAGETCKKCVGALPVGDKLIGILSCRKNCET